MNFHLPCVLHQNNMEYTTFIYKMQAFFHIFFRFFSKSPQTLYFLNFLHALIVSSRFRIQHTVCILRPRFISFRFRQGFEYTAFVSLKPHFFLPIRDSGMYLTTIVCTGISFFTRFCYFFFGGLMTMRQIGFPIAENFSSYSVMTLPSANSL